MELIFEILKKLRKYEIRMIRNHLNASPFEYEKVGKLFDLVQKHPGKEEDFFAEKLYGCPADNTFRVTKSRLKRLLEDVVLNDKSLSDYGAEHIQASLMGKKRLLQGEILLGRGAYAASKNLLLQVTANSRKFGLHNDHFWSMMLLHRNQSINMSVKDFEKGTEALLQLNEINFKVNEAAILHYSVTNVLTQQSLNEPELAVIDQKINQIERIAKETQSPVAAYYHLLSRILYLQYTYDYGEAVKFGEAYLELVRTEPAVRSAQREGSALFQLTESYLRKGDLAKAESSASDTLKRFDRDETNYLIVLGTAFQIAFFQEKWTQAIEFVRNAFAHPRFQASAFRAATWHYFHSCVLFKTGKISESLKALNEATPLLADKIGWNLTFRLHEIIILHEAGLDDILESKIQNIRQFVKRTQQDATLQRPQLLIQVLLEWHKNSMDARKTLKTAQKYLAALDEQRRTVPYDPTHGELIRFEDWLRQKGS